ncbi:MAG: GlcNAc-transferase family protein [Gammaproteobacteria bacterium]|tara:strand:+ start:724 stop:1710 length:987 start_codon:yes stop_codon:yes gene_type:complete
MKIFISIASYQDPMLTSTILSAYENADLPQNLIFGICDQSAKSIDLDNFSFENQIRYDLVDPVISEGPCWARTRVQKMFENEDYYLQIDSHMQFQKGWDSYLIKNLNLIQSINTNMHQLPIITCYPRSFEVIDFEKNIFELNSSDKNTQVISYRKDSMFIKKSFCRQIGSVADREISHGYLLAAGCLFATKEFVKEVPYDPDLYFYGEEISLMLRAFSRGFGIFHIPDIPIFHLYTDISNIQRKLHWNEDEDQKRDIKWHEREKSSINKLDDIIHGNVKGVFGLGKERTMKDYEYISGVDLVNKVVTSNVKAFTATFVSSLSWEKSPY